MFQVKESSKRYHNGSCFIFQLVAKAVILILVFHLIIIYFFLFQLYLNKQKCNRLVFVNNNNNHLYDIGPHEGVGYSCNIGGCSFRESTYLEFTSSSIIYYLLFNFVIILLILWNDLVA